MRERYENDVRIKEKMEILRFIKIIFSKLISTQIKFSTLVIQFSNDYLFL